jgi:hypothetical protein
MKATCGGCDSEWPGETRRAHCSMCHLTFSNVKVFDAHRWHAGRGWGCKRPEGMGLTLIEGTWYDVQNDETREDEDA